MKIGVTVMAHPKRRDEAYALFDILSKQGFCDVSITWDSENSEWETGSRAWEYLSEVKSDYSLVLQDDTVISENLYENLTNAIQNIPNEGILSLYLGRVKPHRGAVQMAFNHATSLGCSYVSCKKLLWGPAIVIPTNRIQAVLSEAKPLDKYLYDIRLGMAASALKMPIYYTTQSLVDHNDELGSLIGHQVNQKRCAHKYQPNVIKSWNSKTVKIF